MGKEHNQSCPEISTTGQTKYACFLSSDLICTVKLRAALFFEKLPLPTVLFQYEYQPWMHIIKRKIDIFLTKLKGTYKYSNNSIFCTRNLFATDGALRVFV